jgi:hypothetical protein
VLRGLARRAKVFALFLDRPPGAMFLTSLWKAGYMQAGLRRVTLAVAVISLALSLGVGAQSQTLAAALPDSPGTSARLVTETESRTVPEKNFAVAIATPKPVPTHRFFDRTALLSMSVETGALLADGIATQARLGQTVTRYQNINGVQTPYQVKIVEVDPIGKLFVNHGWPGTIAGGAVTLGADIGVRYWLHKTNHHRLERILPFALAASNALAAFHDTRY